jgi:hypothetical protein
MYFTSERLDHAPTLPFDAARFTLLSRGIYNTLGNVYRVPLGVVVNPGPAARAAD